MTSEKAVNNKMAGSSCQENMSNKSSVNEGNAVDIEAGNALSVEDIIPGYKTIEDLLKDGYRSLISATRSSNGLPTGHDWDLYTSYQSFKPLMDSQGSRVLELISMILQHQGIAGNIVRRPTDEKLDLIIDANDVILERVGINLDEMDGIRKNPEPMLVEASSTSTKAVSGSWNKPAAAARAAGGSTSGDGFHPRNVRLLTAKNIERPQAKFRDKVDNTGAPFEPRIRDKPNALKPLAILVEQTVLGESFSHPYDYELDRFSPPASQLTRVEPAAYKPLDETPLVEINSPQQLPALVEDLARYSEIAVDLEHHSYRSFQGITCLMQISTRDTDYIVDTLALRDELHCLNEVFTKPTIVKVLHGADHDIEWLQRDLCLYIVNLFDTHQAARLLNHAHLSLAYLLKNYCDVDVDKHFQLADWRIRPLPAELKKYAREDTHYLLYVYDRMRNALLEAGLGQDNLLSSVVQRGVALCKTRYVKPVTHEDSYMDLYRRNTKLFDNRQLYALKEIFNWRDMTARQEDESTGYVLPNHMLLHVCETLPREMQGILACCNPIPPLVRQNLVLIHQIILRARDQPLVKIIEDKRPATQRQTWSVKTNVDSPLHCPHDLTKAAEFRDDLPTLLGRLVEREGDSPPRSGRGEGRRVEERSVERLQKVAPLVQLFENSRSGGVADWQGEVPKRLLQVKFVSPYQRCKQVQPFMQAEEEEEAKSKAEPPPPPPTPTDASDQERIERIREHFVKESMRVKQAAGILSEDEPLRKQIQRKRKHNPAEPLPETSGVKSESHELPKQEAVETKPLPNANKKMKKNKKLEADQPVGQFQPYDYSQVDFNRFKGGSNQNTTQKKGAKNKIKNKNKKKSFMGKSNNQSFTYGHGKRGQ